MINNLNPEQVEKCAYAHTLLCLHMARERGSLDFKSTMDLICVCCTLEEKGTSVSEESVNFALNTDTEIITESQVYMRYIPLQLQNGIKKLLSEGSNNRDVAMYNLLMQIAMSHEDPAVSALLVENFCIYFKTPTGYANTQALQNLITIDVPNMRLIYFNRNLGIKDSLEITESEWIEGEYYE